MDSNNLLMSLSEMNGTYNLVVNGMLTTSSNTTYSNVVFDALSFVNNSPIVNSQLNIYNNIMVMSNLSNSFATNVYSVAYSNANSNINFSNVGDLGTSNIYNSYGIFTKDLSACNILCSNLTCKILITTSNLTSTGTNASTNVYTYCNADIGGLLTTSNIQSTYGINCSATIGSANLYVYNNATVAEITCSNLISSYGINTSKTVSCTDLYTYCNQTIGGLITCSNIQSTYGINTSGTVGSADSYIYNSATIGGLVTCSNIVSTYGINTSGTVGSANSYVYNTLTAGQVNVGTNGTFGQDLICRNIYASNLQNNSNVSFSNITVGTSTQNFTLNNKLVTLYFPDPSPGSNIPTNILSFTNYFSNTAFPYLTGDTHWFTEVGSSSYQRNGLSTWLTISDIRLKENIESINDGLQKILSLNPVSFNWKIKNSHISNKHWGFIADEYEQVFPQYISYIHPREEEKHLINDSVKSINVEILPWVVNAIQQLNDKITKLETLYNKKNKGK